MAPSTTSTPDRTASRKERAGLDELEDIVGNAVCSVRPHAAERKLAVAPARPRALALVHAKP
jgi:hypothetical protein